MKFIKDQLTGIDGESFDIGRCSWAVSLLTIIGSVVFNAYKGAMIDVLVLSQAIGAIVLSHGGAIFVKAKTEPEQK
jgi:hypothetical protein